MLFIWYFSLLVMGRVLPSLQNGSGIKYSETEQWKNTFLQHVSKQIRDRFHFCWRKASSETSGSFYSACSFKQQNIILPVQNHLENLNREWCQWEWKAFIIFSNGQSPKYPTRKRQNCTDTKKTKTVCTIYAIYPYMQSQAFQKSVHIPYYLEMIIDFKYCSNTAVEWKLMKTTNVKQTNQIPE